VPVQIGDQFRYPSGRLYTVTESGPLVSWTCDECGGHAVVSIETTGVVRCSGCLRRHYELELGQAAQVAQEAWRKTPGNEAWRRDQNWNPI